MIVLGVVVGLSEATAFGASTAAAPCFTNHFDTNHPVIGVLPATSGNIFYLGEAVTITSSVPVEVYRLIYGGAVSLVINHASPVTLGNLGAGHYFVQSARDRNEFVVLPSDYSTLNNVGHDDYYALVSPEIALREPRVKFGWVRPVLHWSNIQTSNGGTFNWDARWNGVTEDTNLTYWIGKERIALLVGQDVSWATKLPASAWLTAYSNFLAAAYARYSNAIDAVQVLNEPYQPYVGNIAFRTSKPNNAALEVATFKMAAAAFPHTTLIGPSEDTPNAVARVADFAAAGGAALVAALDYHDYTEKNGVASPENADNGVVHQATANLAALHQTKLYLTEAGIAGASALGWPSPPQQSEPSNPPYNWYRGMTRAMKVAILYQQFRAIIFAGSLNGDNNEDAGFDPNGGIKPKTSAFLMTEYWLNNATPVRNWTNGNLHCAAFIWGGQTNTFLWSSEGTQTLVKLGTFVSDIWSNQWTGSITEEPVIAWRWPTR